MNQVQFNHTLADIDPDSRRAGTPPAACGAGSEGCPWVESCGLAVRAKAHPADPICL